MLSISELVLQIQDRISLPINDEDRFNTAALVRIINSVNTEQVAPLLFGEGGEFQIIRHLCPLQTNGVNNYPSLRIPIPRRAYGRAIREVKFISNGATLDRRNEINVTQTSLPEADAYQNSNLFGNYMSTPMCYLDGDSIQIIGDPTTYVGTFVIYYFLEISDLVNKTTFFSSISNIVYSGGTTTVTATSGTDYDVYQPSSSVALVDLYRASTGMILKPDVAFTRTNSTTWTTTGLTEVEVGELKAYQQGGFPSTTPYTKELYLIPAGQSQFTNVPYEFDSIVVLEASSRILESLGDIQGLETVQVMLKKAYDSVSLALGNRLSGQRKRVTDPRRLAQFQRNGYRGNRTRYYSV
jgi:hypothetical protein